MAYMDNMRAKSLVSVPNHKMDIVENRIVLKVELPGLEKADIEIKLKERRLIIIGKQFMETCEAVNEEIIGNSNQTTMDENKSTQSLQMVYQLRFRIPDAVDVALVDFKSYKNGILVLNLPMHADYMERKIRVV